MLKFSKNNNPLGIIFLLLLLSFALPINVPAATAGFNLQVTTETYNRIALTWSADPDSPIYQVQRKKTSEIDWLNLPIFTSSVGSYKDLYIETSVTYQYRIFKGSAPEPTPENPASEIVEITSLPLPDRSLFFNEKTTYLDTSPRASSVYTLSSGGDMFLARGVNKSLLKSTDGLSWETLIENWNIQAFKLVYHKGNWVASQNDALYYSEDNGVSWSKAVVETEGDNSRIFELFSHEENLYASTANNNILISTDGKSWIAVDNSPSVSFYRFNVSGSDSNKQFFIRTPKTVYSTKTLGHPWKICFEAPEGYKIVELIRTTYAPIVQLESYNTPTKTYISPIDRPPFDNNEFVSDSVQLFETNPGITYVYNWNSSQIKESSNGIDWTPWQTTSLGELFNWNILAYKEGLWTMGAKDRNIYTSTNMVDWELQWEGGAKPEYSSFQLPDDGITVKEDDTLLLRTYQSNILKLTGKKFNNIEVIENEYISSMKSIIWDGSRYVAVGDDGFVLISEDAISWNKVHEWTNTYGFTDIVYENNIYITTTRLALYYSYNLTEWTRINGTTLAVEKRKITHTGDLFFEFVTNNQFSNQPSSYSADGITWTTLPFMNGKGVTYGKVNGVSRYVLVSDEGVFSSGDAESWEKIDNFNTFDYIVLNGEFFIANDERATQTNQGGMYASRDGTNWIWANTRFQSNSQKNPMHVLGNKIFFIEDLYTLASLNVTENLPESETSEISFTLEEAHTTETQFNTWALIFLTRSKGMSGEVSVGIRSTSNGSATEGTDYIPIDQIVRWSDREFEYKPIHLTVFTDSLQEGRETVEIELYNPSTGAVITGSTTTWVIIHDRPMDSWLYKHFGATINAETAAEDDWDNDGYLNFMEYTLGTNPKLFDSIQSDKYLEVNSSGLQYGEKTIVTNESLRYDDRIQVFRMLSTNLQDWESFSRLNHNLNLVIYSDLQPRIKQTSLYSSGDEEESGFFAKYKFTYDENGYLK